MFPSWEDAVTASREIVQGEFGLPAVLRISDPEETEIGLKLKGFSDGLFDKFFRARGFTPMRRSLCIGTVEGEKTFAANVKSRIYSSLPVEEPEFREIVVDFIPQLGRKLDEMKAAMKAGNFAELASLAHWLKGAGGTCGFEEFYHPSLQLEQY